MPLLDRRYKDHVTDTDRQFAASVPRARTFLASPHHLGALHICFSVLSIPPRTCSSPCTGNHGDAAAHAASPDADGPAGLARLELLLGLLAAAVFVGAAAAGLHVPAPAAHRRGGARTHRAPPAPAARHAVLHLPLLHVPLRARARAAAAAAGPRAHAAANGPGVPGGGLLRGPRARARALRGVEAPRGLPQVRAGAWPRGAAARRQRARGGRAGRRREPGRALRRVRAHAAAAGARRGRGVARHGAGRARGPGRDAVVEADRVVVAGRGVRRARGREAGRRAAVARAEDGRVRRGARGRGAVQRRREAREPRARRRAGAPGLAAPACRVFVQARQLEGVRTECGREGQEQRERGRRAADGDAAVVAAAAVSRQHRHRRAGADRPGASGDGDRAGGPDRQAHLGAAGGGPLALAAPLRRLPRHRLAQPRELLHALVRRVAQAARVVRQLRDGNHVQ